MHSEKCFVIKLGLRRWDKEEHTQKKNGGGYYTVYGIVSFFVILSDKKVKGTVIGK